MMRRAIDSERFRTPLQTADASTPRSRQTVSISSSSADGSLGGCADAALSMNARRSTRTASDDEPNSSLVSRERGPDALHHASERPTPGADDEVQMIRLHGPREAASSGLGEYPAEGIEDGSSVLVVEKQISPIDPSDEDVMNQPGGVEPRSARHSRVSPGPRGADREAGLVEAGKRPKS